MIQPGTYKALLVDWGMEKSPEKGTLAVALVFRLATAAGSSDMTWRGYLTEKTTDRTLDTLDMLGFKGSSFDDLIEGSMGKSRPLNTSKVVECVVTHQEYNGKTYARIDWINDPEKFAIKRVQKGDPALSSAAASLIRRRAMSPVSADGDLPF